MLDTDNRPALRESVAAHEGAFFALSYHQFAFFALVTLDAGGFGRGLGRQDVALLVQLERCFAFGIVAASKEGAKSAVLVYHWFAALFGFSFYFRRGIFHFNCGTIDIRFSSKI